MRVAEAGARIGYVFAQRGLTIESCASFLLPRVVGRSKAMEWCITGRVFKASDEADSGLFNYVVEGVDAVLAKAYELAEEVAAGTSGMAVALNRWLLTRSETPEQATIDESRVIAWTGSNADVDEVSCGAPQTCTQNRPDSVPACHYKMLVHDASYTVHRGSTPSSRSAMPSSSSPHRRISQTGRLGGPLAPCPGGMPRGRWGSCEAWESLRCVGAVVE